MKVYSAFAIGREEAPYCKPEYKDSFLVYSLFVSNSVRNWIAQGYGQAIPAFLGEIPGLFRKGIIPIDVALLNCSRPNADGYCSFSGSGVVDHGSVFLSRFRQSVGERKIRSRRRPETVGFVFFVGYLKEPNLFGSFSSLGANGRSRMSVPDSFLRSATPGRFHSDPELQCRIYFRA